MDQERRRILEEVAAGTRTPQAAAEDLRSVRAAPATTVRVVGSFRTTTIIADPTVAEVSVEGPHASRREGDAIVISADEFEMGEGGVRVDHATNRVNIRLGPGSKPLPLAVRMNPELALDVTIAAGALKVDGIRGPIKANLSAGTIRIDGFRSPLDLQVAGGTVTATGHLSSGSSSIRCEAGAVRVRLDAGSSVKVVARAGLGKVALPGAKSSALIGGGTQEAVIGDGEGRLDIEASLGAVTVEHG